ncbi:hypothetical protein GW796_07055 [archaeon]|nr:hypothetical protein [archaeon]
MTTINENLTELINAINHISLNHEDLMGSVLSFSKNYSKINKKNYLIIDKFFANNIFIDQSLMAAREGIVLGMNAMTLDENISFNILVDSCVNIESQRFSEKEICEDENTIIIMQDFLRELRKEMFSRVYSKNKDFIKISKLSKDTLKQRYEIFMKGIF